jgi:PBP1b-binding outer membrane lipoprotein LpoB
MKKISFWFPIFLVMLVMAGCSSSVEDSRSAPTMDDSTKQTIEKLQKEEDQAMNFNSVPAANENSTEPVR